jgi:hypothetical protein
MSDDYPEIRARFERETAEHAMTVLHDDGLYRHLRFLNPKDSAYWFEIVTWPGSLVLRGDLNDAYTFTRLADMFEFFRGKRINPHYWAEKLGGGQRSVQEFSEDAFRKTVWMYVREEARDFRGLAKAVQEHFFADTAVWNTEHEEDARAALDDFSYLPDGQGGEPFKFEDTWEWSFNDYDWSFVWACHAIVWGIQQYDAAKAAELGGAA